MDKFFALPRYRFTRRMVGGAPAQSGVYALFSPAEDVIYIGCADGMSIKACLTLHQDGAFGECTMYAAMYTWEISPSSKTRAAEILADVSARLGRDPRCQAKSA